MRLADSPHGVGPVAGAARPRSRARLTARRRHEWSPQQRAVLIGDPATSPRTIAAVEKVADYKLVFERYSSVSAALKGLDHQSVYAALNVATPRPVLYVASAAGASVARVLEKVEVADPGVRIVDAHPLAGDDPN